MYNNNKSDLLDDFHKKRIKGVQTEGIYNMPVLKPCPEANIKNLVSFSKANSVFHPENSWFHFFLYDNQFERIWNNPDKYFPILQKFEGGISTDFSMYIDMPAEDQIRNCWRNRAMALEQQQANIKTIPNACWGDMNSLEWAFDGLPKQSVLAFTTQGCMRKTDLRKQVLVNGIHELIRQKKPTLLYVYGVFPDEWLNRFAVPIIRLKTFSEKKWRCG